MTLCTLLFRQQISLLASEPKLLCNDAPKILSNTFLLNSYPQADVYNKLCFCMEQWQNIFIQTLIKEHYIFIYIILYIYL